MIRTIVRIGNREEELDFPAALQVGESIIWREGLYEVTETAWRIDASPAYLVVHVQLRGQAAQ